MRWTSLVVMLGSGLALAGKHTAPPAAKLDDPCLDEHCTQHALDGWTHALAAQRGGTADHPLRVSWIGDSLTADDHITHALRLRLQALVGDGGPGFVYAVAPHPYCQHRAVSRTVVGEWASAGIWLATMPDRLLGLGGSAESSDGAIRLATATPVHEVDVHYLAQPHGGSLAVVADGNVVTRLGTAEERKQAAFARIDLPDGAKHVELRTLGRVRLFGASLESPRGAVVDNLGVVNATVKAFATNNLAEHWQHELAHRAPDLVVIMLGTNEAEWLRPRGAGIAEHEQLFGELLASVRAADPAASCLVVSPLDQLDWRADAAPPRDSVPALVEAQHRAARAHGCAFWDVYAWMGGKGSSLEWYKRGLVVKDFQHPTSEGAERIAEALYAALVQP